MLRQPSLFDETHRNHYLFADYYLNNRVQARPGWETTPDSRVTYEQLQELWATFKPRAEGANEDVTEDEWIRPVLDELGHVRQVQVALQTPHGTKQPDYVLFPTAEARDSLPARAVTEADLSQALAVADAKRWDHKLDRSDSNGLPAERGLSQNPSYQIDFYIRHSGIPWGILTNGRHWRLYHRDSSKKLDVYYEVDLPALLEQDDADAFNYFYLFFRCQAFVSGGWLDTVLAESKDYQRGVGDNLKGQVYEALRELAQGFLAFPDNGFPANPETAVLKDIYDNSLIALYRILFILYAESRDLLPAHESDLYHEQYSFDALKQRVRREVDRAAPAGATMNRLWSQLHDLWRVIDRGNEELGVPAYNGGLFNPAQHPFLEQHKVGDRYLRRAIDLLARTEDPQTGRRDFVDYRDLSVRHLGSIYEGLLEYQLRVADQPLRVRREDKREVYEPLTEDDTGVADVNEGDVYLITDKGERKATGSYYTPDYIVQYIVEHTLRPVLDAAVAPFRDEDDGNGAIVDEAGAVQAVLELNVLDPAMGSGHFLVAATDFIARYLVALELQAMETDNELAYWRRRVVQACIYGVDLNPLAVELAKLSLWLNTIARDKPLNFLDHHLRTGNSLIGARAEELLLNAMGGKKKRRRKSKAQKQMEKGQLALLDDEQFAATIGSATGVMGQIEALASDNLQEVRQAEKLYNEQARAATRPLRRLADVWTARHFGLELDDTVWKGLTDYVLRRGIEIPQYRRILQQAEQTAGDYRFFHWELEFPEVFFDDEGGLQDTAGFDVVVGNPPYDELSEDDRGSEIEEMSYLKATAFFEPAMGYRINVYRLFISQAVRLLRSKGWHSFIVPMSLLADQFTFDLRKWLLESVQLRRIEQFPQKDDPHSRVFFDAKLSTCIYLLQKKKPTKKLFVRTHPGRDIDPASPNYYAYQEDFFQFDLENASIPGLPEEAWNIVAHLAKSDRFSRFGKYAKAVRGELMINRSFKPYARTSADGEEVIRGSHVGLYSIVTPKQGEAIFFDRGHYLEDHPNSERALDHRHSRVVYQRYAAIDNYRRLIATILPAGYFCSHTIGYLANVTTYELGFLVTLLNSTLLDWRFNLTSTNNNINGYEVEALPIPKIKFDTPENERSKLLEKGKTLYGRCLEKDDPACVLGHTQHQLDQGRADVIHDLLTYLAEQMIEHHKQRQALERAHDPFKYLDRGIAFRKFGDFFADAVKYGQLVANLDTIHHDIDDMRLIPADAGGYDLRLQLKLRDPDDDWQSWQYEEDGHNIRRRWLTAYHFPTLDQDKARYYRYALSVRAEFNNTRSFPGGYTRTTCKKLNATTLPAYDPELDLIPLAELDEELAQIRATIARTDDLIDQIVYQLYGLTDEEIAVVEGGTA